MLFGFVFFMSVLLKLVFVYSIVDKVILSLDIEIRCWLILFVIVVKKWYFLMCKRGYIFVNKFLFFKFGVTFSLIIEDNIID